VPERKRKDTDLKCLCVFETLKFVLEFFNLFLEVGSFPFLSGEIEVEVTVLENERGTHTS
jgi:hypothetical protein